VIASQYGGEGLDENGADQVVVGEVAIVSAGSGGNLVTNIAPAETTYNPSRLQERKFTSNPTGPKLVIIPMKSMLSWLLRCALPASLPARRPPTLFATMTSMLTTGTMSTLRNLLRATAARIRLTRSYSSSFSIRPTASLRCVFTGSSNPIAGILSLFLITLRRILLGQCQHPVGCRTNLSP
jgi:hypothetical protein